MKLREEQSAVIDRGRENILVSASAGSGKTFVMIERIIRLILNREAEVKDILAITYVKAAAAELKEKLFKAFVDKISEGGDTDYLSKQLKDLPAASVSTLHSFCNELLKSHFYAAGVDPAFKVLDEKDSERLKAQAADEVFLKLYEEKNEGFLRLARVLSKNRRDDALKSYVVGIYDFIISEEKPFEVLKKSLDNLNEEGFERVCALLAKNWRETAERYKADFERFKTLLSEAGELKYASHANECLSFLKGFSGDPFEDAQLIKVNSLPRLPAVKGETDLGSSYKRLKDSLSKTLKSSEDFLDAKEEERRRLFATEELIVSLIGLSERFAERYKELKEEENGVDFSDLEHLAVKVLSDEEAGRSVRERYKYIFADEYQDINGVQEKILSLLSNGNLFMVGDIKQSIYAFRGCNPGIFAAKYADFLSCPERGCARELSCNFRSSDKVIECVNKTFTRLMTAENSKVDYQSSKLIPGGLYPEASGEAVLHVISKEESHREYEKSRIYSITEEIETGCEADEYYEGRLIAYLIEDMLGKEYYDVKEKEQKRITYGDIVILSRSKGRYSALLTELKRREIPVSAELSKGAADYPEIKLIVEILNLLDNIKQDIPLAAVLKSRVGNLSERELLRLKKKEGESFYSCCIRYIEENNDSVSEKLTGFFEYFEGLRLDAHFTGASDTAERIIREKGLDVFFLGSRLGQQRMKRVRRFLAEGRSPKTLTVREFLDRIERSGDGFTLSEAGSGDCVRIMSMHSSKGLEFPVVILSSLSKHFNTDDAKREIILDRDYGLALSYYDEERMIKKDTLLKKLLKQKLKKELAAEELRIFYVAMTRAKAALHLVTAEDKRLMDDKDGDSVLDSLSFNDFISTGDFDTKFYSRDQLNAESLSEPKRILISSGEEGLIKRIKEYRDYGYLFSPSVCLPVKRTVSQLAERNEVFDLRSGFDTGQEKGNNFHAFMQNADFDKISLNELKIQQSSMLKLGIIESADGIDLNAAADVLNSGLFSELKKGRIYREKGFLMRLPANEVMDTQSGEEIIVQGVIDLFSIVGDFAYIVDYKLTRISKEEDLIKKYRKQLEIYGRAVEKFYGIKAKKMAIINLTNSKIIFL